jgi:hypothetical protein
MLVKYTVFFRRSQLPESGQRIALLAHRTSVLYQRTVSLEHYFNAPF